ncbi:MAG: hypothetical protein AB1512_00965 [Thermodesulfobacteriota bacterium]
MQRLWTDLTKATPSNLSVIGPRFVGKTVIMNALAKRCLLEDSPYEFVLHWHLGHVAPASDGDFVAQLCDLLRDAFAASGGKYGEHREYLASRSFDVLKEVTELLDSDGKAILMLWDGFDKPLGQGRLTGHLWDQMRTIFYGRRHKIVTATRRPLSELIRSQDAITSPFWNIFDMNPVRVDAFDDQDCEEILDRLTEHIFQTGAKTELANWSAALPPLFLELLNQILADIPSGKVDNEAVNHAGVKATETLSGVISDMWEDCPAPAKDMYFRLLSCRDVLLADVGRNARNCLIEKCFARQSGNKLVASCRLLQQHLQGAKSEAGSMARLFGTWGDYKTNIRSLLERRLAHISRFDARLHRLVERAIDDIPYYTDDCLNNLTGIRDCALQLIWQREFGAAKCVPQEIITYWTAIPRNENRLIRDMMQTNCWEIPTDPLDQIRLLGLLTGSSRNFEARAKASSKDTYVLIDAIHNFRNRAQHPDGQAIHLGVAVAAIMTCLELLACLERESPP